ncbi:MAG: hypothetical protein CBD18_03940 [Opitutales bacterium TMED158]|nr:MAG: hypothetical protein CBD18_03940 [Opitutales bacterium TMED158]
MNAIKSILILAGIAVSSLFATDETVELKVVATGAKANTGQLLLSVFDSEESYLKRPVLEKQQPVGEAAETVFQIDGLAPGTYAVSIIYDEDSNGKLNTGFLGIPSELVGMSNNAKGLFGPPSFAKCAFSLSEDSIIEIALSKAKN